MQNGTRGRRRGATVGGLLRTVLLCSVLAGTLVVQPVPAHAAATYDNPIPLAGGGFRFPSCPDPTVIRGQAQGDTYWYLYCTTDPRVSLTSGARGALDFRLIPTFRSQDLVNWEYMNDAFTVAPAFLAGGAYLWAPEIQYFQGKYFLYYTASDTNLPGGGSAIGVATSTSPTGPWTNRDTPVIPPQDFGGGKRWVFDPAVVTDAAAGKRYLFYGSYFGGISARQLSEDGFSTVTGDTPIAIPNRYEGATVKQHDGYYYLFVSATDCCRGPLTGYTVFAGRSASALGPYRDRDGVSFLDARVGGTPVLEQSGNRWVGPGHNSVFTDFAGRDWTFYHAVDRFDPYFGDPLTTPTKRPLLLDPVEWRDGWPSVRGIRGPSDGPQPGPAAQPGDAAAFPLERSPEELALGPLAAGFGDEFNGAALGPQWQWVRQPGNPTWYGVGGGEFRFQTLPGELYVDTDTAPVLTEATPPGDYTVETKLTYNLPTTGEYNFQQAGLVIYKDDDNYIKLTHVANYETRQIEFAKEVYPVPANYPRYGNSVLGPPGATTYLRIARRTLNGEENYTAYSSTDGARWQRGATWTHALGPNARIGLVSMGAPDFMSSITATFDYVRVYSPLSVAQPSRAAAPAPVTTPAPAPRPGTGPRGDASAGDALTPPLPTRAANAPTATPLPAPSRR